MSILLVVTNAGRAALVNAQHNGTAPVVIAQCGLSATAVTPVATATALPGEHKRIGTLSGAVVDPDTIHLVIRDESLDAYTVRSIGLYLGDGTLFGIYGQVAPILEKTPQAMMLLQADIRFADIAATSITFGNANFLNPPATETVQGVAEIATQPEVDAGVDDRRIVTPKTLAARLTSWLANWGADIWRASNDGSGSGMDADLLDGQQGSWYANILARLGYTPANRAGDSFTGSITAPSYHIDESAYWHVNGENPLLAWDVRDYLTYLRSTNVLQTMIGGVVQGEQRPDGYIWARSGFLANGLAVWHPGNDGAGSGSDADLLDGQQGSWYADVPARLGFQPLNRAGDVMLGVLKTAGVTTGNSGVANPAANLGSLEVMSNGSGAAMMTFHRTGSHACYVGLDIDNRFKIGGWSMGAVAYEFWHAGNDGSGSGLDADLLDGQQGSWYANIIARLGYTPANKAGDTFTGSILAEGIVEGTSPGSSTGGLRTRASAASGNIAYLQFTSTGAGVEFAHIRADGNRLTINLGGLDVWSVDRAGNVRALGAVLANNAPS